MARPGRLRRGACDKSKNSGFTLIEVMVAIMLLAFALAGILPFFMGGLSQASSVRYKSIANNIARERLEEIRRLDYREITTDATEGTTLGERFGTTATQRDIPFQISYQVSEPAYKEGTLKEVTVTVSWTAPPAVSAAAVSTLIHQQFLGPRGAYLELNPTYSDPLGTPFPWIRTNTEVRYHLAEADWGLVFKDLTQPATSARDIYVRFVFFSDDGVARALGDSGEDYRINTDHLHYTTDADGNLDDVWFEYDFNASAQTADSTPLSPRWVFPDGYMELRAQAYNEYDQPGNVWRLRVRFENGAPTQPIDFTAIPSTDNETIDLYWLGGPETDRSHYVLERSTWDPLNAVWGPWAMLSSSIPPKAVGYTDHGSVAAEEHPWGSDANQNYYVYRLYAVDKCQPGLVGPPTWADSALPPLTTTTTEVTETTTTSTTTPTSSPTTTISYSTVQIVNNSTEYHYDITVKDKNKATVFTGKVKQGKTLTTSSLPGGEYQVYATNKDGGLLETSFSLPAQAGEAVLIIQD